MVGNLALDQRYPQFLQQFIDAYISGPSRAFLRSVEADLLSQVPLQDPILDLACGDGLVSSVAFGRPLDAGCDLMIQQLDKARARQQYRSLTLADARALPYEDETFATVICNSSIEHIPGVDLVLSEVARVIKPGGSFVFTVPNPRFNEWFWFNWICTKLGISSRGTKYVDNFNRLREHHNVFDLECWRAKLLRRGFCLIEGVEYFSFRSTFLFSILEDLWKNTVRVPWINRSGIVMTRVNPAGAILRILPYPIRKRLQVYLLMLFRGPTRVSRGSHLLIVAKKSR